MPPDALEEGMSRPFGVNGRSAGLNLTLAQIFSTGSGSISVLSSGVYYLMALGSGATGAFTRGTASSFAASGGGGSGGICVKRMFLSAGQPINYVVGAAPAQTNSGTSVPGNNGSSSTITVAGMTLTAGGGSAGASNTNSAVANGGSGGIATGGDMNISGLAGGSTLAGPSNTVIGQSGASRTGGPAAGGGISNTFFGAGGGAGAPPLPIPYVGPFVNGVLFQPGVGTAAYGFDGTTIAPGFGAISPGYGGGGGGVAANNGNLGGSAYAAGGGLILIVKSSE